MKSKEEIEKLAEQKYLNQMKSINDSSIKGFVISARAFGFEEGYTQCQEDMAKDVEYWQGEFDHWYQQAIEMADKYNELLNKQD